MFSGVSVFCGTGLYDLACRLCVSVWNVTVFLESALGVDASLLSNMSLTSTGTAGTVRDADMLFVVMILLD